MKRIITLIEVNFNFRFKQIKHDIENLCCVASKNISLQYQVWCTAKKIQHNAWSIIVKILYAIVSLEPLN